MRTNNVSVGQYGNSASNMMIHALLGVVDETYEVVTAGDYVNMVEEIGDLRWFAALFQHATGVQLDFAAGELDVGAIDGWMHDLTSIAKRMFAYGESEDKHLQMATLTIQSIGRTLTHLVSQLAKQKPEALLKEADAAVINKLRARFPEKFTEDHAIGRDTDYEREVLEQSIPRSNRPLTAVSGIR